MATTPTGVTIPEMPMPARFISLSVRAGENFANHENALSWLHTPNPSLRGSTPREAAHTEEGCAEADDLLTRIEAGVLG